MKKEKFVRTREIRKKQSNSMKQLYLEGRKFGFQKGHSVCGGIETRFKIGHKLSTEAKRKHSKALRGRVFSKEHKKKIGLGNKGKKLSKKTKKKMSATKQGINIKDWKKFVSREPYDQNWNNIFKRAIRKRDNQICMLCRVHREKLNRVLSVHHINYDKLLSVPQNCISLCLSCHMKTNMNHKHWVKFFQSLLEEKYGYKYKNDLIVYNLLEVKK